jgi:hypothetical protein
MKFLTLSQEFKNKGGEVVTGASPDDHKLIRERSYCGLTIVLRFHEISVSDLSNKSDILILFILFNILVIFYLSVLFNLLVKLDLSVFFDLFDLITLFYLSNLFNYVYILLYIEQNFIRNKKCTFLILHKLLLPNLSSVIKCSQNLKL